MASEILEVTIKLDTGDVKQSFISIERDAKKAGEHSGESLKSGFSRGEAALVAVEAGIELVKTAVEAVKEVVDRAFEFAKAGEEIGAITKRFEILGEQAGLVPENIKAGIEGAVDGTVAVSDALQTASKAFVELGGNAGKLPEIFELSRKAAQVFGGETTDRVEQISRAIETGSTRQLRSIGIIVNSSKVYAEYARSLGVSADFLNENQKQQAILNDVLEKGSVKFKQIDESITPIAEKLKKSEVASKELGETFALAFNKAFGSAIKDKIDSTTLSLEVLNVKLGELLLGKPPTAAESLKLINREILNLIKSQDIASAHGDIDRVAGLGKEIEALQKKLIIEKQLDNQAKTKVAVAENTSINTEASKKTFEQLEILRKLNLAGEVALSSELKAVFDARKADNDVFYGSEANVIAQYNLIKRSEELKYQNDIKAIKEQFKNLGDSDLVNSLIEAKEFEHVQRLKAINRDLTNDSKLASGQLAADFSSAFDKMKATATSLSQTFKQGLVNVVVTGIQSIATSLVKGENVLGNFAKAMLGVFGNLATQLGTILIGTGIGITSLTALDGFAAIAAGAGLVAIGAVLSALSGGGDSSAPASTPSTSTGGGISAAPGTLSSSLQAPPQQPQTNITVQVQGDIYDKTDTGLRIVDILRNTFSQTGATLPSGIIAV